MGEMAGGGEESDKRHELFKCDPVRYRVDRRSVLKIELRRFLSEKLSEFLGDLADETLVEYIVVLLCNGKNQYQAREGLLEILGDNTEDFVAWLWDYLSRARDAMEKPVHTTSKCKRMKVQRPDSEVEAHTGNTSLVKEGPVEQLKCYAGSQVPSNNSLQEEIHGGVTHEGSLAPKEELYESVTPRKSLQKKLRSSVTEERLEEGPPSRSSRRISSGILDRSAPCLTYPEEREHYKRGEKVNAYGDGATRSSSSFHKLRSEVMSIGRNMKSSNRETLTRKRPKKLPKLAMDEELKPVQRNVWDRLGKPQTETNKPFLKERINSFLPIPTATSPPIHPLVTLNLPSTLPVIPHAQTHFLSTGSYPEGVVGTTSICTPMRADREIVNKLKRQFEQIENHLQASVVSLKSEERVPAKQRLGISVGAPQPLPVSNWSSSNMANEQVVVQTGFEPEIASVAESRNSEQNNLNTLRKEKALENLEFGNSDQEPPTKVSDMKVKLEEMENDMQELRSKHAQLENIKADPETNPSSGSQPGQMEDVDSRTVLVTNVHFGATKEAIVSHFAKCGPVTKVIMLRDTITAKPKGAACVIFTKRASVEKAISLSGTSLFSRTLKVMRKADAPVGLLEQPHQVCKQAHSLQLPPSSWNLLQSYPMATHLQWRRETTPCVPK